MIYIGIDPGKNGAICLLRDYQVIVYGAQEYYCKKDYDIGAMENLFPNHSVLYDDNAYFAIIERGQAMPGQGCVSMFSFGMGYGLWLGLLTANKVPYQIVHSRVWTKEMLKGAPGEGKERSFHVARQLYPQWTPKLKRHQQYSDAILLATYGQRIHKI